VVQRRVGRRAALTAACLAVTLGGRTLRRTALRMADLLDAGDLEAARTLAPALVARRADGLGADELARATVESLAENTADAVAGPLVWTAVAGAPGAVAYRAANTLDAMVGYRDERYRAFGWAAARLDDALNWPVARLTAAATVVAAPLAGADARAAASAWRRDGHRHPSPNGGQVEAAFAGALGVRLGGANRYGDAIEHRPHLGDGRQSDTAAIRRAARLSACVGWLLAAALALVAGRRAWA
jgi:adenosylcobinamide-phosphate synthase